MKTRIQDSNTAAINLEEDALYVVKNGEVTKVNPKSHGQDVIVWKNGQVLDVDRSERIRINGQKVI
ncbi:DUF3954 domain-containing protein [Gracilibacillus xinjiangensis]|uniref:DUF3954 domain-containing protein n=1 Tax=Gracilibacillus xinjiangensis TaxID=1193282 RepID=A0ABV8WV25_9BACI